MKNYLLASLLALASGCSGPTASVGTTSGASAPTLSQARSGFKTKLDAPSSAKEPVEAAPAAIFRTIKYAASGGLLAAYLSPDPGDGKKHPAIVWITGGDCNSIGDVWSKAPADNDQTAAAYREAGIMMMFPSLRGGNDNPGQKEGFLGEVDDVLAAVKTLEVQPYVDAKRIYLGGHSTGGTLALLVAESSVRFRGAFAFGPVGDVAGYGKESGFLPFNIEDETEVKLRSPAHWLDSIASLTWIIEGTQEGNLADLQSMRGVSANPNAHFLAVEGASHFSILAPVNALIARKIAADHGPKSNLELTETELKALFSR